MRGVMKKGESKVMKIFIGCFVVGLLMVGVGALAQDARESNTVILENGKYNFRLIIKEMAKGKDDITLPAEFELKKEDLLIKTQGMMGNKITLSGILKNGNMKFGMTDTERENIISFHYIGKVDTKKKAHGKIFCFVDGKAAFGGDWILTKKKDESGKTTDK